MRTARVIMLAAVAALAGTSVASAQLMGTVFLDFDGHNGAPQGNVTALDASIFPGLAAANTAALRATILAGVQADYAAFSINITDVDPGGTFTRVVVGNTGTQNTTALGVANEIDFRNKRQSNIVSVLADVHANPPVVANYTLAQAAQFMTNTTSHELGHVLGLVHSDVATTFEASGQAAVRQNEIMKAVQEDADAFRNLTFGDYSRTKLRIAQDGINMQPEQGGAVFTSAFVADPARNGDAGSTVATGTPLVVDAFQRVTALGTLGGADATDIFKFSGTAGQKVTVEAFSQTLTDFDGAGATFVGRIANPLDPVVAILNSLDAVLSPEEYNTNSDLDGSNAGDAGSDSLIYKFVLPATGTYGVRVTARGGGDAAGDYELLVWVPEPSTFFLLTLGVGWLVTWRRRFAH